MQTVRMTKEQIEKQIELLSGLFSHVRLLDAAALDRLCAERLQYPVRSDPAENKKPLRD